jgi:hypothetical protein
MDVELGGTTLADLARTILGDAGGAVAPQFGFSTHAVKEAAKQH